MQIEGKLGEWAYTIEVVRGLGRRCTWHNPPPAGTKLLATFDELVTVDEVGLAGMLHVTNAAGIQSGHFPGDLKVPA